MSWWESERGRGGVGGGCHGDSNTPVALPTCLPGPNLLGEGGDEGAEGEGGVRKQEMERKRGGLHVLYTFLVCAVVAQAQISTLHLYPR